MSDKNFDRLNELDQMLRRAYPVGMNSEGTDLLIRKYSGFELFNTRPYHNYETWSDGYQITDGSFFVEREDLDDAVNRICALRDGTPAEQHEFYKDRIVNEFAGLWYHSFFYKMREAVRMWKEDPHMFHEVDDCFDWALRETTKAAGRKR